MWLRCGLVLIALAFISLQKLAGALPTVLPPPPPSVECDDISKYTVQFWRDHVQFAPPASTCLFYTSGLTEQALELAHGQNAAMTTIWDVWDYEEDEPGKPRYYYSDTDDPLNPLRCIFDNSDDKLAYFTSMSQAFAELCDIFATLMTENLSKVFMGGVWGRTEFPTLQQTGNPGGQVDVIKAITPNEDMQITFWTRTPPGSPPPDAPRPPPALQPPPAPPIPPSKRDLEPPPTNHTLIKKYPAGVTPKQLATWFDDIVW